MTVHSKLRLSTMQLKQTGKVLIKWLSKQKP